MPDADADMEEEMQKRGNEEWLRYRADYQDRTLGQVDTPMAPPGFTDEELMASAREDAFTGIIKVVALKQHPELRAKIKPHFEAILEAIDEERKNEQQVESTT